MRFTHHVTIARPRDVVWRAFTDPALRQAWDARLRGAELLSGIAGQAGAISRLVYAFPGRRLVLVETVVRRIDLEEFVAIQAGESLGGRLHGTFAALPGGRTRWRVDAELHLRDWWILLSPLARLLGPWELARDMHRFRRLVEGGDPRDDPSRARGPAAP